MPPRQTLVEIGLRLESLQNLCLRGPSWTPNYIRYELLLRLIKLGSNNASEGLARGVALLVGQRRPWVWVYGGVCAYFIPNRNCTRSHQIRQPVPWGEA